MSQALIADRVSRSYDDVTVLDQVSLALQPGMVTALLGGSGAGKSTLLRLFAGLEPVEAGEIRLGDTVLSSVTHTHPAAKRKIGLIFQDFALFPHLTAARNVAFGLAHLPKADAMTLAAQWLARLDLADRANAYPHELSGGEQQRVAIARALAPEPMAILMDEPFSGLDPALRGSVRDAALSTIRAAGIPALLVTHDPAEALESADRIAILRQGHLLQEGSARDVYMKPNSGDVASALGPVNRMMVADWPNGLLPPGAPPGDEMVVRPEGIIIDPASPTLARIVSSGLTGPMARLVLDIGGQRLVALVPRFGAPIAGEEIGIRLDPALTFIFGSD